MTQAIAYLAFDGTCADAVHALPARDPLVLHLSHAPVCLRRRGSSRRRLGHTGGPPSTGVNPSNGVNPPCVSRPRP